MTKCILGVDPGLTGALALIGPDGVIVEDLPIMANGKGGATVKNQINGAALAQLLRPHVADIRIAIVEQVSTMRQKGEGGAKQGMATNGSLMHSLGVIQGVLAALGIPVQMVAPASWKKAMGLVGTDKEVSRAKAQQLFPAAPLARKKDHNRAEALLLAVYGQNLAG